MCIQSLFLRCISLKSTNVLANSYESHYNIPETACYSVIMVITSWQQKMTETVTRTNRNRWQQKRHWIVRQNRHYCYRTSTLAITIVLKWNADCFSFWGMEILTKFVFTDMKDVFTRRDILFSVAVTGHSLQLKFQSVCTVNGIWSYICSAGRGRYSMTTLKYIHW